MRPLATSLLAFGIALAAAAAAATAGGASPHLEKVAPARTFAGEVVEVSGSNFSDAVGDVAVTVGGKPAIVLETTLERLRVLLPTRLATGFHALEVQVAGARSNQLELTILAESERPKREEGGGAVEGAVREKLLTLDSPEPALDRGSLVVRVSGEARFPDGCTISLKLKLDGDSIATIDLAVQSRRFGGAFGPYTRDLFAGNYWVEAVFNLEDQAKRIRDLFKQQFKDPLEYAAHERALDRQPCRIGSAALEAEQAREIRMHVARSLARARALTRTLETAYAGAGRSAFAQGRKVDEAAWEAWLAKHTLRSVPRAQWAARTREIREKARFITEDGAFAEAWWREWLDFKFRAEVFQLMKEHLAYRDRYLVVKYPDAMTRLEELFGLLGKLSRIRSCDLYALNHLPVAAQDGEQVEGLEGFRPVGGQVTPALIESAARRIARDLNLTPAEEAQAAAEISKEED